MYKSLYLLQIRHVCLSLCQALFTESVTSPWRQGVTVLGIVYQEEIYMMCQEGVAFCVLADELLYS